jgi:hypothetical protein
MHTDEILVVPFGGNDVIPLRENGIEASRPSSLRKLLVAEQPLSSRTWSVFRYERFVGIDRIVQLANHVTKQQRENPLKSFDISRAPSLVKLSDMILSFQITLEGLLYPLIRARHKKFSVEQAELPDKTDTFDRRVIQQQPSVVVEHLRGETLQECREPPAFSVSETGEDVVLDGPTLKTFLEVRSEVRQGYREKR